MRFSRSQPSDALIGERIGHQSGQMYCEPVHRRSPIALLPFVAGCAVRPASS